jgi:hypothetical protein
MAIPVDEYIARSRPNIATAEYYQYHYSQRPGYAVAYLNTGADEYLVRALTSHTPLCYGLQGMGVIDDMDLLRTSAASPGGTGGA